MTGTQALLRLLITQRLRDALAGHNTAAFVSGYRGSPVGGVDLTLSKAAPLLKQHAITFQPGVNEELASTALWGTQQIHLAKNPAGEGSDATVDGVLGMWYGKGPGVDRCPDVWRHASGAGTTPLGGVLAVAGDDHAAKSSTYPNHSDGIFSSVGMPLLYPASVQEIVDLGIHGYALSRFCGAWVGLKGVTDVVESAAIVDVDINRVQVKLPTDYTPPAGGLHIRWPDAPNDIGQRVWAHKMPAALAYARANGLNRTIFGAITATTLGIITAGKSVGDTLAALRLLGLTEADCKAQGVSVYQCGMIWPLEPVGISEFCANARHNTTNVLVVEELRPTIEAQLKEVLYAQAKRPAVHGKNVLPVAGEYNPLLIATAIVPLLPAALQSAAQAKLAVLQPMQCTALQALGAATATPKREPWFCSGCPHSTSTRVPEGSRALAGIGCHYMALWMNRDTATFTQMGGEGAPWIGAAPYSHTEHVFANLGDGTYFHSGVLAVRAAIAAGVNMTYKILYNDAVSMTGGQAHDGVVTAHSLAAQMLAEGAAKTVVVSYQPKRFDDAPLPAGVTLFHRNDLDDVQRTLRGTKGCTVLIYDQPCATEKRRKLKAAPLPVAERSYALINPEVCEGCGDCSVQSNCLSVEPLDTPLGRKRAINQSSCNTDMSCLKGFCPSFVTVTGAALKKPQELRRPSVRHPELDSGSGPQSQKTIAPSQHIPHPNIPALSTELGILVAGVGGTGVVTIGQLLGMAAHLEGKGCSVLDMSGIAQKGGPVQSHIRLLPSPAALPTAAKLAEQQAAVVLACDAVVASSVDALARMQHGTTQVLLNLATSPTADWLRNRQWQYPNAQCEQALAAAVGDKNIHPFNAQTAAVALLGDAIYTNPMMLGYAWQAGWLPLKLESMQGAITLNAAQVSNNLAAFDWGRLACFDAAAFEVAVNAKNTAIQPLIFKALETLQSVLADRIQRLSDYQNAAYAKRYQDLMQQVQNAEAPLNSQRLSLAVAKNLYKLMAIKDEYEVARLYTTGAFAKQLNAQFELTGKHTVKLHLAPPLLGKTDSKGQAIKQAFNARWVLPLFKVMAACKGVRGTALDVFGYTAERRMERELLADYERAVVGLLAALSADNLANAVQIASLPDEVRGFGRVKLAAVTGYREKLAGLIYK